MCRFHLISLNVSRRTLQLIFFFVYLTSRAVLFSLFPPLLLYFIVDLFAEKAKKKTPQNPP